MPGKLILRPTKPSINDSAIFRSGVDWKELQLMSKGTGIELSIVEDKCVITLLVGVREMDLILICKWTFWFMVASPGVN